VNAGQSPRLAAAPPRARCKGGVHDGLRHGHGRESAVNAGPSPRLAAGAPRARCEAGFTTG